MFEDDRRISKEVKFTKMISGSLNEAVSSGASIAGVNHNFSNLKYGVKFYMEVMNFTKFCLEPCGSYTTSGYISVPQSIILPGEFNQSGGTFKFKKFKEY